MYNPEVDSHVRVWEQISTLAAASGLQAVPGPVATVNDLDTAVETLIANGAEAFIDLSNGSIEGDKRVAALALSHHLVSAGLGNSYPAAGGLLSFGPDVIAMYRRGGYYVDRILKGAKPATCRSRTQRCSTSSSTTQPPPRWASPSRTRWRNR